MLQHNAYVYDNSHHTSKKVGLVFSGGGGKGAYEVGVWRALEEFGISSNIGAVSGTSVGALNAALYAQGDLHLAEYIWQTISPESILTPHNIWTYLEQWISLSVISPRLGGIIRSWFLKHLSQQGVLSQEGLSTLIWNHVELDRIRSFSGPIYVTAYNLTKNRLDYFDLRKSRSLSHLESQLLASASIPVIFGETCVDECRYVDGGIPVVGDNTPIKPLYTAGIRKFVVVHLAQEEPIDRTMYPDCHIIEIMPQADLGGLIQGTLNFDSEQARLNMLRGYDDACRILAPLFEVGEAQARCIGAMKSMIQTSRQYEQECRKYRAQYQEDLQAAQAILSKLK